MQAFQKGSPLAPDVSREILEMKDNGRMDGISRKWFGEGGCGSRIGTAAESKRLTVKNFKGLFLISGLSSFSALAIFSFTFLYKNRRVLRAHSSLKQKVYELAEAFDRERDDESLPSSNKSRTVSEEAEKSKAISSISSCYEEGMWSSIELVVTTNKSLIHNVNMSSCSRIVWTNSG